MKLIPLLLLLALTGYAAPSARDKAIESRWLAYSMTNASVQAYRLQLSKLYPIEKRLQNQANLLYRSQGAATGAAQVAARKQTDNVMEQLGVVQVDISRCKIGIERIKLQFTLTIADTLPQ